MWNPITASVLQGSILGPLLFLIFSNDIVDNLKSDPSLYADDTCLVKVITSPRDWLSENMSWDKHVKHELKCSTCTLSIVNLQKMYHCYRRVKFSICKTSISPFLEYATPVFNGNVSKTHVDSLENVQRTGDLWLLLWGLIETHLMRNFYMSLVSSH